jgi:hypothetical protein
MKFSKKDFKKKYKPVKEDEVDESLMDLLTPGGKQQGNNTEVYTDTQELPGDDSSDFETDIPLDTDKFKTNTKNTGADMARGGNMGVRYGVNNENVEELDEASRDKMKALVQELLKQRTKENDIVSSDQYADTDSNNKPDINQLTDINLINKTNEFLKVLANSDSKDAEVVLNHLKSNIKRGI